MSTIGYTCAFQRFFRSYILQHTVLSWRWISLNFRHVIVWHVSLCFRLYALVCQYRAAQSARRCHKPGTRPMAAVTSHCWSRSHIGNYVTTFCAYCERHVFAENETFIGILWEELLKQTKRSVSVKDWLKHNAANWQECDTVFYTKHVLISPFLSLLYCTLPIRALQWA